MISAAADVPIGYLPRVSHRTRAKESPTRHGSRRLKDAAATFVQRIGQFGERADGRTSADLFLRCGRGGREREGLGTRRQQQSGDIVLQFTGHHQDEVGSGQVVDGALPSRAVGHCSSVALTSLTHRGAGLRPGGSPETGAAHPDPLG